jgi:hypothetical protein
MWIYRYIQRLPPDLRQVKQKPIGRKRFEARFEKERFIDWFNLLGIRFGRRTTTQHLQLR